MHETCSDAQTNKHWVPKTLSLGSSFLLVIMFSLGNKADPTWAENMFAKGILGCLSHAIQPLSSVARHGHNWKKLFVFNKPVFLTIRRYTFEFDSGWLYLSFFVIGIVCLFVCLFVYLGPDTSDIKSRGASKTYRLSRAGYPVQSLNQLSLFL